MGRSRFDDSSWKLLRSDEPWTAQGYPNYTGFAWYRFRVILPPTPDPLACSFRNQHQLSRLCRWPIDRPAEREMPPHEKVVRSFGIGTAQVFLLPAGLTSHGGQLTIAIRVWRWSGWSVGFGGGGPSQAIFIGDAGLLRDRKHAAMLDQFRDDFAGNILLFAYLLAGLSASASSCCAAGSANTCGSPWPSS